ncbi:hypothetical protein HII36_50300 [Nonomuraea sp. NN258]|uniref:hypothetical protein n=1 Tax=Nonomuraea antri TaxID=2730852 RepID=UPI001567EE77|nr:hypothetical protein [Nonomuraea antri]NRQ39968.1 hypothetical protein [Nonomuraea antri]
MVPDLRQPLVKQLAEADAPRRYWHTADDVGGVWLFESVEGDGEEWAVRQIEVDAAREMHRYWWGRLQDEHGFLTDQPLEIWELTEITGESFEAVWRSAD